ncbi:MAG: hypothetical protein MUE65_06465 [Methanomassiliicoccales archaeon]|nr:hypothetical protein [Methanomassiliicoccales archaeon]
MASKGGLPEVRGWVLILLTLSGFLLVVASALSYEIEWIPRLELGLFRLMPLGYWAGMALMALSLVLGYRSSSERTFFAQGLFLYLGIWCAPVLYLRLPDVWDSYMHYFSSLSIAEEGSVLAQGLFSYSANYPGFFIVGSTYDLLADPDVFLFLKFYSLFVSALTLMAVYLFVRTYLPGLDHRFAFLVSIFGNVWLQYNFSPQSMGLMAGLMVFVFLEKEGLRWDMLALASFIYVVVSHPTTAFFVVAGLIVREVVVALKAWRARSKGWEIRERPWPIIAFMLVWLGWLFTGAREYSGFLWQQIVSKLAYIFEVPEATSQAVGQRTAGNIFFLGPYLRLALLGVLMLFLILAVLHWWRSKRRRPLPGGLLAMAFVPIVVIPLDIFILQGQVYDRGFLYFALSAPILITLMYYRRWTSWRKVAALMIVAATVMSCASVFYQESLYVVSERSVDMSEFLDEHVAPGTSIVGGTYPDLVWRESNWTQFTKVKYWEIYPLPFENLTRERGAGMIFDRTTELWQTQWGQLHIYDFYLDNATEFSKVYESGAYMMIYGGTVRS